LEGSGRDLTELLIQVYARWRYGNSRKPSVLIAGVPAAIPAQHLPNTSLQGCRCMTLFDDGLIFHPRSPVGAWEIERIIILVSKRTSSFARINFVTQHEKEPG
jgi:hypothetical protein